jgi:hypothetical protein
MGVNELERQSNMSQVTDKLNHIILYRAPPRHLNLRGSNSQF